jgi:hypothetical protein
MVSSKEDVPLLVDGPSSGVLSGSIEVIEALEHFVIVSSSPFVVVSWVHELHVMCNWAVCV